MLNNLKKGLSSAVGTATFYLVTAPTAMAQTRLPLPSTGETGVPRYFTSLQSTIGTIFKIVITAAGVIFILLFLLGGIQYLTAAGNEENTGKARRLLIDAIVGLIIVLAAWALGNYILKAVGLQSQTNDVAPF